MDCDSIANFLKFASLEITSEPDQEMIWIIYIHNRKNQSDLKIVVTLLSFRWKMIKLIYQQITLLRKRGQKYDKETHQESRIFYNIREHYLRARANLENQ